MKPLKSPQFHFTLILISLTCLTALIIAAGYVLMKQNQATKRLNRTIGLQLRSFKLADQLRQSSDDLTKMVRTYAATRDSKFEEYFYTILNIRDGKVPRPEHYDRIFWDFIVAGETILSGEDGERISLQTLMEHAGFTDEEFVLLAEAKRRSDKLVELEEIAMNAMKGRFRDEKGTFSIVKSPDRDWALQVLFGKEYHQAKNDIMKPIDDFLVAIENRTSNAITEAQKESRSLSSLLTFLLCCLLIVLPLFIIASYRYHRVSQVGLRESEERFRSTFEQAAVGIAHVSPEGRFLHINERFCDIVGYSREEMIRLKFQEITHPDDLDADIRQVSQLLAGEIDTYSMEKRYFRKNGEITWIHLTVSLVRNEAEEPQWFVAVVKDINERQQAEVELRESEKRFRSLMEQSPLAIEILTPEGQISKVNTAWMRLWDFNEEETAQVLAKYNMLTDKQTVDLGVAPLIRKAFAGEPVVLPAIEYVVNRTTEDIGLEDIKGKSPWIQCHLFPVKNANEEIVFVVNTYLDITKRKQAEKALQMSEANLIKAQDVAHIGSWQLNLLENNLVWTDEIYRIFGVSKGTPMTYEKFLEVVHPEDRDYVNKKWNAAIKGEPYDIEHRLLIDNEVRWVREKAELNFDDKGNPTSGIGITQDITEHKQIDAEVLQLRNEYAHIARVSAMGELVASLAHELKQPLAAIRINAQAAQHFLTGDKPDIDELHEILRDIVQDDRRADSIIGKLRTMMRKSDFQITEVDINEVVQNTFPLIKSYEMMRNISLELELDKDVPHVGGDQTQLQQVVLNLILNSTEALTNTKADLHTIVVRTRREDQQSVILSVTDDGPGINDKDMDHLFEPFYTTKKEGLGMGLAISRSIIEKHGGRLWAENNPDNGVTFYFTVPIAKGASA